MTGSLVLLTGASGVGKTTIASEIEKLHPEIVVFRSDALIGVPTAEEMTARYGAGPEAGSAWQREVTQQWLDRIVPILASGQSVLLDLQTRIAFLLEAIAAHDISHARIILVECDDETRNSRLIHDRKQPELANENMAGWARYLHQEALAAECEIIDTGALSIDEGVERIVSYLLL
ncbi:AAA family ATPase [Acidicapsa ligni]|uniref:AAA family ATPase n=1 Tax=Acidicapsa ligni TaxID=542300 RepID=UPI0021E0AD4C|nr:ATP-binding protein [Acidicapsa ligni]